MKNIKPLFLSRVFRSLKKRFLRLICPHEYKSIKSREIGATYITLYECVICGKEKWR